MKHALTVGVCIVGLLGWLGTVQAELRVHQDRFTLDVQGASLEHVLEDFSRQGSIAITILEGDGLDKAIVSKQFTNLSIEEGLHQLLLGWNYGLTKDRLTGRVQHVFIASERTESLDNLPITPPVTNSPMTRQLPTPSYEKEPSQDPLDEFSHALATTDEFSADESEEDNHENTLSNTEEFPRDMTLNELPPDVRQAMLRVLHDVVDSR